MPVHAKFIIPENNYDDVITMSGNIEIKEKLYGPIDLSFDHSRCTLNMSSCEKFSVFNLREGCKKLNDTNILYSSVVSRIFPRLVCPIPPGNYTIRKSELNLMIFKYAPFDGYIYLTIAKAVATDPVKKTRVLVWCNKIETKIVKVRVRT